MTYSPDKFCDTCGAANRAQARFCIVCGASFGMPASVEVVPVNTDGSVLQPAASVPDISVEEMPQNPTGTLPPHSLLKQRYMLLANVGRGGFGAVYKAMDTQFGNRQVAVKEMGLNSLDARDRATAVESFNHEAHLLAGLTHPNLPRIYEQFSAQGRSYLVMDYIDGETLEQQIKKLGTARMPVAKVLAIGLQLCNVLEYLHTRQPPIIFRDLKPGNVMLTPGGHIYLIDFGIARHFKPGQKKDTTALGSSGYAPPEQYGKSQTTARADIYSLGATLHQLFTGDDPSETPFRFEPMELTDPLLEGLEPLIMSMVSVPVDKRPENITVVREQLHRIMARYVQQRPQAAEHAWSGTLPVSVPAVPGPTAVAQVPIDQVPTTPQPRKRTGTQGGKTPMVYPQVNTRFVCQGHTKSITTVGWSPDGKLLASGGVDRTVHIWEAATGRHLLTYKAHNERVNKVAWSPDSKLLVSASEDHDQAVHVWNVATGRKHLIFKAHSGPVSAVAWSPDGKFIASGGGDKTIQVWDAVSGEVHTTYEDHNDRVLCLAWSLDGKYLAAGGKDAKVTVREFSLTPPKRSLLERLLFIPRSGQMTFKNYKGRIIDLAWLPDNKHLATVSADHHVYVRNIHTNDVFDVGQWTTLKNTVAVSPNGKYLALGGTDKTVRIWNPATDKETLVYYGHSKEVSAVAWSPDGSLIASGGVDYTLQVWQAV